MLASPSCAAVLSGRPEIFEAIPWDPDEGPLLSSETRAVVRRLRNHPFDLAVALDSGDDRRARVMAALSGARLRVGIHPRGSDPTLNLVVAQPVNEGYRPVQSLEFLAFLGIPRESLAPGWEIPRADREYARRLLDLRRNGRDGWLLGVDPGEAPSGARPSPGKLAWLVDRIAEQRGALPIILSEDMSAPYVQELRKHLRTVPLEASIRGIRDILSFIRCCDLFLAGNTSLFHFATALDVPTLGLFGGLEEARWVPENAPRCRVIRLRRGETVHERDFLRHVDDVQRADFADLPIRLRISDEPRHESEATAPLPEEGATRA